MDSLLCTEEWLPIGEHEHYKLQTDEVFSGQNSCNYTSIHTTVEDHEEAFRTFLGKEVSYMPEPGYLKHVTSDSLVNNYRLKAICWIIRSQRRLNLSPETVFCAANYLDRFISVKLCQSWKHWVFELLAVACLSVASKYNEAIAPSFRDILQMEDLENFFEMNLIQRMELTLVKALQWRLGPITSYSYVELLSWSAIDSLHRTRHLSEEFTASVTKLLLNALLDGKFVEFRPCVIAMSAVEYISKELHLSSTNKGFLNSFNALIRKYIKEDDLSKCYKMMDEYDLQGAGSICSCPPSSPVTVLETQQYHSDFQIGLYLLKRRKTIEYDSASGEKRKKPDQEHDECGIIGDHHRSGGGKEGISN